MVSAPILKVPLNNEEPVVCLIIFKVKDLQMKMTMRQDDPDRSSAPSREGKLRLSELSSFIHNRLNEIIF
jgi:hypothetical protein